MSRPPRTTSRLLQRMNAIRMSLYIAVPIFSIYCISNTPIGEWFLRTRPYVVFPPDTSSKEGDEALKELIANRAVTNYRKRNLLE